MPATWPYTRFQIVYQYSHICHNSTKFLDLKVSVPHELHVLHLEQVDLWVRHSYLFVAAQIKAFYDIIIVLSASQSASGMENTATQHGCHMKKH